MKNLHVENLLKRLRNVCENYENRGTRVYPNDLFEYMDESQVSEFLYGELVYAINFLEYNDDEKTVRLGNGDKL